MTPSAGDVYLADTHFLTTIPLDRLVDSVGRVDATTLRRAQRAVVMSL